MPGSLRFRPRLLAAGRDSVSEMPPTLTMGIDLAAQPENTAVCLLAWPGGGPPELLTLVRGCSEEGSPLADGWLSAIATGQGGEHPGEITKVGIDDPFGWPVPFLDALAAHRDGPVWPLAIEEPTGDLRYRETDKVVAGLTSTGRRPLSVSADRIAIPAMRCAAILADIAGRADATEVARDGSGLCCEVYPDPALRLWTDESAAGLAGASYKRPPNSAARVRLRDALLDQLPIVDPRRRLDLVEREDDYVDALVCALVARAAELGLTHEPDAAQRELALVEGWIHIPSEPLAALAG
jgi:hypothetical protein